MLRKVMSSAQNLTLFSKVTVSSSMEFKLPEDLESQKSTVNDVMENLE